jgi:hypothetical protein
LIVKVPFPVNVCILKLPLVVILPPLADINDCNTDPLKSPISNAPDEGIVPLLPVVPEGTLLPPA